MKRPSVTIIVSHFNSPQFLATCIRQIRRYSNPEVDQHIIISDQSNDGGENAIAYFYKDDKDITVVHTAPLYSGYGVDWIMRYCNIQTDYVCQLHVDAFPIHKNWLLMTIGMMESFNLTFAGVLQFICEKEESIYPWMCSFFSMAQSFHVGRTAEYKEMSLWGGFTRFHNRPRAISNQTWKSTDDDGNEIDVPVYMGWESNEWNDWAASDYNARGSDDDVPAFFWEDVHRQHNKMGFGITGKIGVHGEESGYGSIIEDMVFHFGFCRESKGVMEAMGKKYGEWTNKINAGFTDELIDEMLSVARMQPFDPTTKRIMWDGKTKTTSPSSYNHNSKIHELKTATKWES